MRIGFDAKRAAQNRTGLGNYSRFVRPEAVRHDVVTSEAEDPYGVMCSAFRNADGRWVAVVINYGERQRDFSLSTSDGKACRWTMYRTSDISSESLSKHLLRKCNGIY